MKQIRRRVGEHIRKLIRGRRIDWGSKQVRRRVNANSTA